MSLQALPYVVLTGLCFGSSLIASRFGLRQFDPISYTSLRLLLASLAFLSLYLLARRRYPWPTNRRLWGHGLVLGMIGTAVPTLGIILSLQYQSSGLTAILMTAGPALTVVLSHFFLIDEKLTLYKSLGVALALAGALLLALRGESGLPEVSQASPIGYGLVLMALLSISATTIYTRKFLRGFAAIHVTSIQVFVATLVLLPLSLCFVGLDLQPVGGEGYFALVWSALVGTFSASILFFYDIRRFGATTAALTGYVVPIAAGLGGLLILDERITGGMVAGMGIIILGLAIINRSGRLPRAGRVCP